MDHRDQPVFDINRPEKVGAPPTSRPVIVGHRPTMPDPMVTGRREPATMPKSSAPDNFGPAFPKHVVDRRDAPPAGPALMEGEPQLSPAFDPRGENDSAKGAPYMPVSALTGISSTASEHNSPKTGLSDSEGLSVDPKPGVFGSGDNPVQLPKSKSTRRRWPMLVVVVLLLIAVYLLVDALTTTKLPYELFKKSAVSSSASSSTSATPQSATPALPTGYAQATITGTQISFAYPSAWGRPASSTEKGFTQRSAKATADSDYAYIVTFPTNKDVELAITSTKALPPSRAAKYYDFLQWCTGSVDAKFYKSLLRFSTTNGVDTPTTTTCDQGPLADAVKLGNDSIVQANTKNADGSVLGDLYTRNLTDKTFVVARLKDVTMKNATDAKAVLASVSVGSATSQ